MDNKILYAGDTAIGQAASYLAGIMTFHGIKFDYIPSNSKFDTALLDNDYSAIVLSDYSAGNFSAGQIAALIKKIESGMGLVMIGGWDSFTGVNGNYGTTTLREVLPVIMSPVDDRVNYSQTCLIEKNLDHPIIDGLPFDEKPTAIGGFNKFTAKPDAKTILSARRFEVTRENGKFIFRPFEKADPLLVTGQFAKGRVAAFASDVAPHWVGPFVDWADSRITAHVKDSVEVEVGNWYAEFFARLIKFISQVL